MVDRPDKPDPARDRDQRDAFLGISRHEVRTGETVNADPEAEARARSFAIEAGRSLQDDKCEDVLVLDLRGLSQVTDFFVIASGTSHTQMRAAGQNVAELGAEHGFDPLKHNLREPNADWLIIDFVDVVVHVFEPETRLFYDLEMFWGDAPRLPWRRPGDPEPAGGRDHAGLGRPPEPPPPHVS